MKFYDTKAFQQLIPVIAHGANFFDIGGASQRQALQDAAKKLSLKSKFNAVEKKVEFINDDGVTVGFLKNGTHLSLNKKGVVSKLKDKFAVQQLWQQAGIPVPGAIRIKNVGDIKLIKQSTLSYPLVAKPLKGSGGAGISIGLNDEASLIKAINYAQKEVAGDVLIENFVTGLDVRCYMLNGALVAASSRLNAYVLGNGTATINELIAAKNQLRAKHPHLKRFSIPDLPVPAGDGVPEAGTYVQLQQVSNLHRGGESVEVTSLIPSSVKRLLQKAIGLIPGAGAVGIDILIESFDEDAAVCFIEANSGANINVHLFPLYGKPVDVALLIMQAMVSAEVGNSVITGATKSIGNLKVSAKDRVAARTLSQIRNSGLFSSNICSYAITNEALQRHLDVAWYTAKGIAATNVKLNAATRLGNFFEISDGQKRLLFDKTRCLTLTENADKYRDKAVLRSHVEHIVSMPAGCSFSFPAQQELLNKFVTERGFPLVIKPVKGSMGKGVFVNLQNAEQLGKALQQLKKQHLLVEQYITGQEYRVYVLGGNVVSVVLRQPAQVTGDAKTSLNDLIKQKNISKRRRKLPIIKITEELLANLSRQNFTLDSIPGAGENVILSAKLGRSAGGDITSCPLHEHPGLMHLANLLGAELADVSFFGADFIVDATGKVFLLEINCRPQISSALLPDAGTGVDIPALLLDHYFPQSEAVNSSSDLYDHKALIKALTHSTSLTLTLAENEKTTEHHSAVVEKTSLSVNTLPLYKGDVARKVDYRTPQHFLSLGNINQVLLRRAAWQSGGHVEMFFNQQQKLRWSVTCGGQVLKFRENMPPQTSHATRRLTNDKQKTKKRLQEHGVTVPAGLLIPASKPELALDWFNRLNYKNAVVKPIDGSGGRGVTSAIDTESKLLAAIVKCGSGRVLLEQHIDGSDHRLMVIGGRFVAAIRREPASILGDGKLTIKQLVAAKNAERKVNPYTGKALLTLDSDVLARLEQQVLAANSVLAVGQKVFLQTIANIGAGGDSYDVTEQVHPDFIDIAQRCWHAFSELAYCGIDLIAADISKPASEQACAVIEINANCDVAMHHFPTFGAARDVAGAVMAYLFPLAGKPEQQTLTLKITGKVQQVGYRKWMRKQATMRGISGWVENLPDGSVGAVISGQRRAVENLLAMCANGPAKAIVNYISYEMSALDTLDYFLIKE